MKLNFKSLRLGFLLLFMLGLAACQSQQELVSGLSEREANEILVVLQSQKMDPVKTSIPGRTITYSVSVKEKVAPVALRILVENKLPRVVSQGLADVYPVGGGGLIPTASEEKAKYIMALQGEIENMFKILPGIVEARVVIVMPDTDAIRDINTPPPSATASVAIVYNPIDDKGSPSITTDDVKYLVSSAVEDLPPSGVTVVMASNVPMRLIDIAKNPSKKSVAIPTTAAASTDTPQVPPSSSVSSDPFMSSPEQTKTHKGHLTNEHAKKATDEDKKHMLIWLFAGLAVLGLMLGIFGVIRAISLRSKFNALQAELSPHEDDSKAEIPPQAAAPEQAP